MNTPAQAAPQTASPPERDLADLRQAQKMESVGQMTGGLVHDFNNLLTGVLGNLDLLSRRLASGDRAGSAHHLHAAQGAAQRAATLARRLLAFARQQPLAPARHEIDTVVIDLADLIRQAVGARIHVDIELQSLGRHALFDMNEFESVVLNLCLNARDAMPDGGALRIRSRCRRVDAQEAAVVGVASGEWITLSVQDTGAGMSATTLQRIFEPFFTTKPAGTGTGLGLPMVQAFVHAVGGRVRVQSEIDRGTTVTLWLPRCSEPASVTTPVRDSQPAVALLALDETAMRNVLCDVTAHLGMRAVEARNGLEALRILRSDARFDVLVTEVALAGGISGDELADAARDLRPGLQVLLIANADAGVEVDDMPLPVLRKPLEVTKVADHLRKIVSAHA